MSHEVAERTATSEIAGSFGNVLKRADIEIIVGICKRHFVPVELAQAALASEPRWKMLPDAPGVWFDNFRRPWVIHRSDHGLCGCMVYEHRDDKAMYFAMSAIPHGGWLPASPPLSDDERQELERNNAELSDRLLEIARTLDSTEYASRFNQLDAIRELLKPLPNSETMEELASLRLELAHMRTTDAIQDLSAARENIAALESAKELWAKNHGRAVDLMDREEKRADEAERRCKAIEDSRDKLYAELAQAREQLKSVQWAIDAKQLGRSFNSMSQQLSAALERAEAAEAERDRLREVLTELCKCSDPNWYVWKQRITAALAQAEKPQ